MPTPTVPNDQDLDPLEKADQEEDEVAVVEPTGTEEAPAADDHDAAIEEEIGKVAVEEDEPAKQKAHMIPRDLIDRELSPEDLWDEGEI